MLYKKLRIASKPYRKRYGSYEHRGKIVDRVSIDQRPTVVDLKQRYGDFEADTIIGKNHQGAVLTLVERKSYFTLLGKLEHKKADITRNKMINPLSAYKEQVHTITADNGLEFADHKIIAEKLSADFYFTHPYSAWEKAINENTNGLIRQYLPRSKSMAGLTQWTCNAIAWRLNSRPRKVLNLRRPHDVHSD